MAQARVTPQPGLDSTTLQCQQRQPEQGGGPVIAMMRHGRRLDSEAATWSKHAAYPWDTPLSHRGKRELLLAGPKLRALQPHVVVVSPFLRCLETAASVLSTWEARPHGDVLLIVDRQMSEVHAPHLMYGREQPSCLSHFKRWWWRQGWKSRAERELASLEDWCTLVLPSDRAWPPYPEEKQAGLDRYDRAVRHWTDCFPGANILFITHGDAVLSGVRLLHDSVRVDAVAPGGWMAAERSAPGSRWQVHDGGVVSWNGVELSLPALQGIDDSLPSLQGIVNRQWVKVGPSFLRSKAP